MNGRESKIPDQKCPCGEGLDTAGTFDEKPGRGPQAGDVTLCSYCGRVLAFRADLTLRDATVAEIAEAALLDPKFLAMRAVIKYTRMAGNARNN